MSNFNWLHPFANKTFEETTAAFEFQLNTTNLSSFNVPTFFPCNNEENLIDESTASNAEMAVHLVVLPVLVVLGVVTNIINIMVFARQGLSDRVNLLLFSRAVADLVYLLTLMAAKSYTIVSFVDKVAGNYWQERFRNTMLGIFAGFLNTSNSLTAVIAVERCICVAAPFRARRLLKTKYMAVVIVGIYVYTLGLFTLLNWKFDTVLLKDDLSNTTKYVSRLSPFYIRNKVAIDILQKYILTNVIPLVSLVIVIASTCVTVHKLRASVSWHSRHGSVSVTSAEKREAAVTSMLVTLCCVYVICLTPSVITSIVSTAFPDFLPTGKYCNTFRVTAVLLNALGGVNSSINFYIYYARSSRYRKTLSCFGLRCKMLSTKKGNDVKFESRIGEITSSSFH